VPFHCAVIFAGNPERDGAMARVRSCYLTTRQAAAVLGVSRRTLENYRLKGGGPPFLSYCNCIRYLRRDLHRWAAERRLRSTSDDGGGDGGKASSGKPDFRPAACRAVARAAARRGGWLTERDLAALLGVGRGTLARHRARGLGPRFERVSGQVRYVVADVEAWLASCGPFPAGELPGTQEDE